MKPPYEITSLVLQYVTEISLLLGKYEGLNFPSPSVNLRRENRIKTIYSSLVIEGNSLSKKQITAVIDGKPVLGSKKDIQEVKNAIVAYDSMSTYKITSITSFLSAHKCMLKQLIDDAGRFRTQNVGVFAGGKVAHVAPKYTFVPQLMDDLFLFMKNNPTTNVLILSSICHYEIEFIHPFKDGNGRMGRLWQTAMLSHWNPIFEFLPIESLIRENQEEYYTVLGLCDKKGDSTLFIEFMLSIIKKTLFNFMEEINPQPMHPKERLQLFKKHSNLAGFTRKDYVSFFKTISTATASRDLALGVTEAILKKSGNKNTSGYCFL